jgi:D-2-hydroxyacid dehydrogenase (NADP+)
LHPSILVIDPKFEWYRARLCERFPSVSVTGAPDGKSAQPLAADAEVMMGFGHHFTDELVGKAKRLKWIQAFTTGMDQVLGLKTLGKEVILTSMRGIHGTQMSEMAFMHMLVLSRSYRAMSRNQDRGVWERFPQHRLAGKTVVIVGVGLIAEVLAPRCKAFEMNVIGVTSAPRALPGFNRMMKREDLEKAAALADFLIVLAPHTPENEKLIGARVIAAMKPTAFIINIARGPVVDEESILAAVREKRIGGAGLDVFVQEPLPSDHPFWREECIMITPRHSGATADYHELAIPTIERNLACFLEGRVGDMINVVPQRQTES